MIKISPALFVFAVFSQSVIFAGEMAIITELTNANTPLIMSGIYGIACLSFYLFFGLYPDKEGFTR